MISLAAWWGYRMTDEARLGYSMPFGLMTYLILATAVLLIPAFMHWRVGDETNIPRGG